MPDQESLTYSLISISPTLQELSAEEAQRYLAEHSCPESLQVMAKAVIDSQAISSQPKPDEN